MEEIDLTGINAGMVERASVASNITEAGAQVETETPAAPEPPKAEDSIFIEENLDEVLEKINEFIEPEEAPQEPEKPEEKPEDTPTDKEGTEKDEPAESVYSALADFLKEKGVFSDSVDVTDEESFITTFNTVVEDKKYSGLSEAQRTYLMAIEGNTPEAEAEVLASTVKSLDTLDKATIAGDSKVAAALISEDLKTQGWDEPRINKHIERLIKLEELTDEALVSKDNLKAYTLREAEARQAKAKEVFEANKQREEEQIEALKKAVYDMDYVFETFKVDDTIKNKVYEAMIKPAGSVNGVQVNALTKDRDNDPIDFEKRLYYAYTLTNGFRDLKRLQRRAENAAAKKLKNALSGMDTTFTPRGKAVGSGKAPVIPNIVKV